MNKYMDIHKQTHKTYALHTIISGFLPQVHLKKKSIQVLSFFYKHCHLLCGYTSVHCRITE